MLGYKSEDYEFNRYSEIESILINRHQELERLLGVNIFSLNNEELYKVLTPRVHDDNTIDFLRSTLDQIYQLIEERTNLLKNFHDQSLDIRNNFMKSRDDLINIKHILVTISDIRSSLHA